MAARNKLAEFKVLEEEKRNIGFFKDKKDWVDWHYKNDNSFSKRMVNLISSLSEIEIYLIGKRKRTYIPESMGNPFFLDYSSIRSYESKEGCINFPKTNTRKPSLDLTGKCKEEFENIITMVNAINKNKTIPSNEKYKVLISPVRPSLRGKPVKNSWAIKIIYPDNSISVFYHIVGMYHIATNIEE